MAKMTEDDVRALYKHCRELAPVMSIGMRLLQAAVDEYRKQERDWKSLRDILFDLHSQLGWHVSMKERKTQPIDWSIVESVAERSTANPKSSVAYMVLKVPGDVWGCIRWILEASEDEVDARVEILAAMTSKVYLDETTQVNLLAEEGRVLQRQREADAVITGYLGLIVNKTTKTITREGYDGRIEMINKPALWPLFLALFKAAGQPLTSHQIGELPQEGRDSLRQNKAALKGQLSSLRVTITDGQRQQWKLESET